MTILTTIFLNNVNNNNDERKKTAKSFIKFTFLMLNYLFRIALRLTTLN